MAGIKPKYGECSKCEDGKEVLLYRRNPPECKKHYEEGKRKQYAERAKEKPKKKPVRINNFSAKKAEDLKKYRPIRDAYLKEHRYCEVHDCGKLSTNLHHRAGRKGSLLYDTEYFMACCSTCHPQRIHENPEWARENGYILTVSKK